MYVIDEMCERDYISKKPKTYSYQRRRNLLEGYDYILANEDKIMEEILQEEFDGNMLR